MKNRSLLVKSMLVSLSSSYVFFGLNFIGQIFLARLLLPEHFGVLATVIALNSFFDIFFGLSVPMAYVQAKHTPSLFGSALFLSVIASAFHILISILAFYPISIFYDSKIALFLVLISFAKPLSAISSLIISDLEKQYKFANSYLIRGIALAISMMVCIILAFLGFEENSLIIREFLNGLLLFVAAYIWKKQALKFSYNFLELKNLFFYSLKMLLSRGCEIIYFKIPIILIAALNDVTKLGYFTQAFYLVSLINTALNPITEKVGFVFYSNKNNSKKESSDEFNIITLLVFLVTIPAIMLLFYFPEEIIKILFGEQWLPSSLFLETLCFYALFQSVFNNLKSYYYSKSLNIYVAIAYLIASIVSMLLIYYDMIGLGFTVSMAIALLILFLFKKRLNDSF